MRTRILDKMWNVRFVPAAEMAFDYGACDHPSKRGKEITLRDDLYGRELVDTVVHEALHAGAWYQLDEAFIERLATDISKLLWRREVLERIVDDDELLRAITRISRAWRAGEPAPPPTPVPSVDAG